MAEPTQTPSLAERALGRLKKLADGNGLDPASLVAIDPMEQIIRLKARIEITPLYEAHTVAYVGGARGKNARRANSSDELRQLVDEHQKTFRKNPDWIDASVREIKGHENQGWGLEGAKVTLPQKSAVFAASQPCPTCQGQKFFTCTDCQGTGTVLCPQCAPQYNTAFRGREMCYYCFGRTEDPQHPGKPCPMCQGTRFAPCRSCQTRGIVPCLTCHGNRGTTCTACKGQGLMTQEVSVTCGAETHFTVLYDDLPSGVRRGIDRIGLANLGKGHADITATEAPKENSENGKNGPQGKIPVLLYEATMPYAEIKINLGGKKALVSALGKRCALSGVPNFLDISLSPWREKLRLAAFGQGELEGALEPRAFKDILGLILMGKGRERDVRRLYPFGLSSEAIGNILKNMDLALKKTTLRTRSIMATLCAALGLAFFFLFFFKGIEYELTAQMKTLAAFSFDFGVLISALALSWGVLNLSTRFTLQQRFPNTPFALHQSIGKTGATMLGFLIFFFVLFMVLTPTKPLWLMTLLAR